MSASSPLPLVLRPSTAPHAGSMKTPAPTPGSGYTSNQPPSVHWGERAMGAGDGNRTHVNSLEGCRTTIVLRPLWCICLVARRGFEPLISGLKGRRPSPLDERARRVDCAPNTRRSVRTADGGRRGFRTPDLQHVKLALFQLS